MRFREAVASDVGEHGVVQIAEELDLVVLLRFLRIEIFSLRFSCLQGTTKTYGESFRRIRSDERFVLRPRFSNDLDSNIL